MGRCAAEIKAIDEEIQMHNDITGPLEPVDPDRPTGTHQMTVHLAKVEPGQVQHARNQLDKNFITQGMDDKERDCLHILLNCWAEGKYDAYEAKIALEEHDLYGYYQDIYNKRSKDELNQHISHTAKPVFGASTSQTGPGAGGSNTTVYLPTLTDNDYVRIRDRQGPMMGLACLLYTSPSPRDS